jgi:hypothetical protein
MGGDGDALPSGSVLLAGVDGWTAIGSRVSGRRGRSSPVGGVRRRRTVGRRHTTTGLAARRAACAGTAAATRATADARGAAAAGRRARGAPGDGQRGGERVDGRPGHPTGQRGRCHQQTLGTVAAKRTRRLDELDVATARGTGREGHECRLPAFVSAATSWHWGPKRTELGR